MLGFLPKNKDPHAAPAHTANDQGTGRNAIAQRPNNKNPTEMSLGPARLTIIAECKPERFRII